MTDARSEKSLAGKIGPLKLSSWIYRTLSSIFANRLLNSSRRLRPTEVRDHEPERLSVKYAQHLWATCLVWSLVYRISRLADAFQSATRSRWFVCRAG